MNEKIESLLKQMTLEEKVSLLAGADNWHTVSIEHLGIPSIIMQDGPNGLRIDLDEIKNKAAFCFPVGISLGSSWNEELVFKVGEAIAKEAKHRGVNILLGPNVNIIRSPLNGRNFETYSEDPYLTSRMGIAFINGVQSMNVGTSIKHYICNNSEYKRMTISSEVRERALREIYMPAFKAAVEEADPWTVMASYNKINGIFATEHYYLLNEVLKGEWGYKGFVVSDWTAVHNTIPSGKVGMDLEMPGPAKYFDEKLVKAVENGDVSFKAVDDKVRRILRIIYKSGSFDEKKSISNEPLNDPQHSKLAREAASEGMVLLKNEEHILPLDAEKIKKIAVIGPSAPIARIQGGGSAHVNASYRISPLEGIKNLLNKKNSSAVVDFQQGSKLSNILELMDEKLLIPNEGDEENGLTAEFYENREFKGEPVEKITISRMQITNDVVPSSIKMENLSFKMKGKFKAPKTGKYKFSLLSLGLTRLHINGKTVDNWDHQIPGPRFRGLISLEKIEEIELERGKSYDIMIEFKSRGVQYGFVRIGCEIPSIEDKLELATQSATNADYALVCVGLSSNLESEGFDRPHMKLPVFQNELIKRIVKANKNTIVILNTGSPIDMRDWVDNAKAVIQIWYPGQECGNAIADIIFGDVNPSGKLTETFPVKLEDNPAYINYPGESGMVHYGEDIFVGYRYYDTKKIEPLFPFGHGLSYTKFEYSNLKISSKEMKTEDVQEINVDIKNIGEIVGKEIIQLYIHDVSSSLVRPNKELKGFKKILLEPGNKKSVKFEITKKDLSFYDPLKKEWIAEPGEFKVLIGSSSRDIHLEGTFSLK
ncbi:MAG: beta-glucosidase H [Promethearchaeota archaeon]